MEWILLLQRICEISVEMLMFMMIARAVLSFIMPESANPLVNFVYAVTEFCITPVRVLCDRMNWFQESLFDMPFMLTMLVLWVLEMLFSAVGGG